jgi:hypothetical protein
MTEQEKNESIKELDTIIQDRAILFAQWNSKEGYDNMFEDIDNDGRTWASYFDESKRFTIKELYDNFMIDYLC